MKILTIDFDDLKNPLGGGQARYTFEINRRLVQKGHEVVVLTGNYRGAKDETVSGIKYIRLGLRSFPWNFLSFYFKLPSHIKKIPHDILIDSFSPPVATTFAPFFTRKPSIGVVHWLFAQAMSRKYKLPFATVQNKALKFYKNFIVLNSDYKTEILKLNPLANILINEFPAVEPSKLSNKEEDYILFLGRIDIDQKGLDLLVESFEKIGNQIPDRLVIAGRGRDENKLKKLIADSKVSSKIDFVGGFDIKERNKLLSSAKFVLMPSRYECSPFVAKETMAAGKPLIVFDIPGVRATVGSKAALLIEPFNRQKFVEGIAKLAADSKLRQQMGRAGRIRFEKLPSWDQAAKAYEDFCQSIVLKEELL